MNRKDLLVLLVLFIILALPPVSLCAQNNELTFSVGGIFTSDQNLIAIPGLPCNFNNPSCNVNTSFKTDTGVALEGAYARRIVGFGHAALYAEFPIVGVPQRTVTVGSSPLGAIPVDISSFKTWALFFTPSAKLTLFSVRGVSPFVSVGGGLAHFSSNTGSGSTFNLGVLQYGGGLDFKTPIPLLGFRVEARDFYSGSGVQSSSFALVKPERLHHVFVGGGAVLRF